MRILIEGRTQPTRFEHVSRLAANGPSAVVVAATALMIRTTTKRIKPTRRCLDRGMDTEPNEAGNTTNAINNLLPNLPHCLDGVTEGGEITYNPATRRQPEPRQSANAMLRTTSLTIRQASEMPAHR